MKNLSIFLFACILQTQSIAQYQLGNTLPIVTLTDIDGNSWDLQEQLNAGKHLLLLFAPAEYFYQNDMGNFDQLNTDYATDGPDGSDLSLYFYIETNPNNSPEDLVDPYDYPSALNFPIVDADQALLDLFGIDETVVSYDGLQLGICPNGIISISANYYFFYDYSPDLISYCSEQPQGLEIAVNLVSSDNSCSPSIYPQLINHGTEVITNFDYTITIDEVAETSMWSGTLLPYNSAFLSSVPITNNLLQTIEFSVDVQDLNTSNNITDIITNQNFAGTNHLRIYLDNIGNEGYIYCDIYDPNLGYFYASELYSYVEQIQVLDIHLPDYGCYELYIYGEFFETCSASLVSVQADGTEVMLLESTDFYFDYYGPYAVTEMVPFDLTGAVFHDQNEDGLHDSFESGIGGIEVQLGNQTTYTNNDGMYAFPNVNIEDYTEVSIVYDNALWPTTTTGAVLPINNSMNSNFDFGLSTNEPFYLLTANSWEPWFFCGFDGQLYFTATNDGNTAASGTLTATLDPLLTYTSAWPEPLSFVGNTVVWDISLMPVGGSSYFTVNVVSPSFEQMGATLTTTINTITYDGDGIEVANTTDVNAGIVNCSYDPNDKTGFPSGATEAHYIENGTDLEYLVRFQNTGNYQAFNIRVDDQLDSDLDFSTFEFIGSSHPCTPVFNTETGFIQFYFDNINLPDSTTNEVGSHGWFRYRIAPHTPLTEMTLIENTALIYFDFNPAVVTNTYTYTVSDLYFGIEEMNHTSLMLYPNPADNHVRLDLSTGHIRSFKVFDVNGKMLIEKTSGIGGKAILNIADLSEGVYFVEAFGFDGQFVKPARLIVQR